MTTCLFLSLIGQVRLELLQQRREENGAKMKYRGKDEHSEHCKTSSEPQPVHSTAHSVVVWQLLNGTC